ncbi:hypothetical protein HGM15179_014354, partial [Zosterops borbonicus]
MWVSAHMGEKTSDVIAHWRQTFALLGVPSALKADNGPAYTSQKIQGNTGYLRSVPVLTCDRKGRIRLTGKLETVTKMKSSKWRNYRVMTQMQMTQVFTPMVPPQADIEYCSFFLFPFLFFQLKK